MQNPALGATTSLARLRRTGAALVVGTILTLAACGDDGNDRALRANQAARAQASATLPADETAGDAVAATVAPVSTSPAVEPTGVVVPVVALDNSFRPELVSVSVGDEVQWENRGINDHDVLYVDGDDWGIEVEGFGPGAMYAHVFTEPGEYRYYCSIHGNETVGMTGTIIVEG